MTSQPNISDVTSYYDGAYTTVLILYNNAGQYGYIALDAVSGATTTAIHDGCYSPQTFPFNYKSKVYFSGLVQPISKIETYNCQGIENCSLLGCSNTVIYDTFNFDSYPIMANSSAPSAPPNLTVTPGDGKLNISWGQVSDPSGMSYVFAYYVNVNQSGTPIKTGHVNYNYRNIDISGLTNGVTYTVEVTAVSHSNIGGTSSVKTGTPQVCTPNWQCEQPLNGYENDGCGNRRLNPNCDICKQPLCGFIVT